MHNWERISTVKIGMKSKQLIPCYGVFAIIRQWNRRASSAQCSSYQSLSHTSAVRSLLTQLQALIAAKTHTRRDHLLIT